MESAIACLAPPLFLPMMNSLIATSSANWSHCEKFPAFFAANSNFRLVMGYRHHRNQPSPAWSQTYPPPLWTMKMRNISERSDAFLMEQGGTA